MFDQTDYRGCVHTRACAARHCRRRQQRALLSEGDALVGKRMDTEKYSELGQKDFRHKMLELYKPRNQDLKKGVRTRVGRADSAPERFLARPRLTNARFVNQARAQS